MSKIYIVDGKQYTNQADIPELGSIVCTSENNGVRNYEGLSADVSKLPKYDDLKTGSSFFAIDTGAVYKFEKTSNTWYEL